MTYNEYNNIMSGLTNLEKSKTEVEKENAIFEFEKSCYIPFYENLERGFVYPSEDIFDTLEFFLRLEETEKVEFCANMLKKYYKGFLTEKFDELISEENYELCAKIKDLV